MMRRSSHAHGNLSQARRRRPRQGGFNFSEVLFAVMILGIGFIMIAAIFPVALQQTKLTGQEVIAGSSARAGVNFMKQVGQIAAALPNTVSPNTPVVQLQPAGMNGSTVHFPGAVYSFRDDRLLPVNVRDDLWNKISGNLILPSDNRLAWVAMYRRGATYTNTDTASAHPYNNPAPANGPNPVVTAPDAFAQVIVIAVEVRNRSLYDSVKDLNRYAGNPVVPVSGAAASGPTIGSLTATLEPRIVYVKLTEGNTNADQVQFVNGPGAGATGVDEPAAGEGAFIVISDDQQQGDNAATTRINESNGTANGRIYRLGTKRDDLAPTLGLGVYDLAPGWDMTYLKGATPNDDINENLPPRAVGAAPNGLPAIAYIVGRGRSDPNPTSDFEGEPQDVAVYTSIVPAN